MEKSLCSQIFPSIGLLLCSLIYVHLLLFIQFNEMPNASTTVTFLHTDYYAATFAQICCRHKCAVYFCKCTYLLNTFSFTVISYFFFLMQQEQQVQPVQLCP